MSGQTTLKNYPLAPGFDPSDLWLPSFTPAQYFEYSRSVGKVRINLVQMTWYGLDHSYIIDLIANRSRHLCGKRASFQQ